MKFPLLAQICNLCLCPIGQIPLKSGHATFLLFQSKTRFAKPRQRGVHAAFAIKKKLPGCCRAASF